MNTSEARNPAVLLANLGAEEGPQWHEMAATPAVATTARLWQLLFESDVRLLQSDEDGMPREPEPWPVDLGSEPQGAAFEWLTEAAGLVPWLSTQEALERARQLGRPLAAPAPDVVARVHDKAYALDFAQAEGFEPRPLRGLCTRLVPELLERPDDALSEIRERVAGWPAWTGGRFTLKPCLGSSGRGRCAGEGADFDPTSIRGALPRMARRGGALLEPWLTRTCDLSAQMWLGEPGELLMLGTSQQVVSPAGVYLGQRGEIDSRGRVFSGSPWEEDVREAGAALAQAAGARGFRGPCGVDAFAFRELEGRERLRPIVELNARFTSGVVAIGLLRRAHARIRELTGLAPGERRAFQLSLKAPEGGWAAAAARARGVLFHLSPGPSRDDEGPGLLISETFADLDAPGA